MIHNMCPSFAFEDHPSITPQGIVESIDSKGSIAQNLVQHLFVAQLHKHDMVTTLKISMTRYGILITITVLFGRVDVVADDLSPEQSFTVSNRSSLCLCIFHVQHRHLPVYVRWQFWQQVNAI